MAKIGARCAAMLLMLASATAVHAQYVAEDSTAATPQRPAITTNRWEENWEVLSDPALRTEPFDSLKYIPLLPGDPYSYLSFGLVLRERVESNNAPNFGVGHMVGESYLLQRFQAYADLHFNRNWELFTELEDDRAFGKEPITPVDQDPLDLRLAFLGYNVTTDLGTFKARIGRQDFAFDTQRFVAWRDGPNVRQSFDAVWADWESEPWRVLGFISQPVQYNDIRPFDDTSNSTFRFDMFRVERHVFGSNELSFYYARYARDDAHYLAASGRERRDVFDARFAGKSHGLDWDLEGMGQTGNVGAKNIGAWAVGARCGYTMPNLPWQTRLGIQVDAASGNEKPGGTNIGTFNPLFPNGLYFTLAGFTGYTNLIHVKPSVTIKPTRGLSVMAAVAAQWRETTADAIYVQPNIPLAGTAGQGGSWTGVYAQARTEYQFTRNLTGAIEAVHFQVGNNIRHVGGHDGDYLGVELKFGW
jgi:hypothetical protein